MSKKSAALLQSGYQVFAETVVSNRQMENAVRQAASSAGSMKNANTTSATIVTKEKRTVPHISRFGRSPSLRNRMIFIIVKISLIIFALAY
ncbi:hypothetical protein Q3C19_05870 [Bacteroides sp. ET489]|nr:hypothetical protein [Bacteroides sp. ET489]